MISLVSAVAASILSLQLSVRVGFAPLPVRVTLHISKPVPDNSVICFELSGDASSASCWPPQDKQTWQRQITLPEGVFSFQGQIRWVDTDGRARTEVTPTQTVEVGGNK